jgi:hypothetical protein
MAGSDTFSTYIAPGDLAAADPNGICLTQTPGGAVNLTINGALQSGGVATLVPARNVTITSGGSSETGKTFTVTGTATDGTAVTEAIAGPGGSATVSTTALFETVTQVAVDGATSGAVTVGSGTTVNQVVFAGRTRLRGIYFVNSAAAGVLDFKNGASNGTTVMQLMTSGTASTADYPDIPDEGVLCSDGAYVNFTTTDVTAFTVFYN